MVKVMVFLAAVVAVVRRIVLDLQPKKIILAGLALTGRDMLAAQVTLVSTAAAAAALIARVRRLRH